MLSESKSNKSFTIRLPKLPIPPVTKKRIDLKCFAISLSFISSFLSEIVYFDSIFRFGESLATCRAYQRSCQFLPAYTHPSDLPGRISRHQGMIGHIFSYNGASANEGVTADGVATDNRAVCTQRGAVLDEGGADLVHLGYLRAWIVDVRENHRWSAENAVFKGDAFIDRNVVLKLAFVADGHIGTDDAVLADIAVLADFRAGEDVGKVPYLCVFAEGDVVVNDGGGVDEDVFRKKWDRHHFPCGKIGVSPYFFVSPNYSHFSFLFLYGVLAAFEDFEDTQALFAGSYRFGACFDRSEKGPAFGFERLLPDVFEVDGHTFCLVGHGKAVLPVDCMGIVDQLPGKRFRIIENEHAAAADDHELLLLVGIQPAHEDMRADPRGELEIRHGDIGDAGMQEVVAYGIDETGLFAGEAQNHGYVMGGEGPQDVFLAADLAEGEAARIDILKATDGSFVDELFQTDNSGVVLENMADEKCFLALCGQADQLFSVAVGQGKGFFHKNIFVCQQGLFGQGEVQGGRRGDDNGPDGGIGQDRIKIVCGIGFGIGRLHL